MKISGKFLSTFVLTFYFSTIFAKTPTIKDSVTDGVAAGAKLTKDFAAAGVEKTQEVLNEYVSSTMIFSSEFFEIDSFSGRSRCH